MEKVNIYGDFKIVDSSFTFGSSPNKLPLFLSSMVHIIEDKYHRKYKGSMNNIDNVCEFIRDILMIDGVSLTMHKNTVKITNGSKSLTAVDFFFIVNVPLALCAKDSYIRYYDTTNNELYDMYKNKQRKIIHINTNKRYNELINKNNTNKQNSKLFMRKQYYELLTSCLPPELVEKVLNYLYPKLKKTLSLGEINQNVVSIYSH